MAKANGRIFPRRRVTVNMYALQLHVVRVLVVPVIGDAIALLRKVSYTPRVRQLRNNSKLACQT